MESVFQSEDIRLLKTGRFASLALAISTIATFAFAMIAIPISGANAPAGTEFAYPFLNTLGQFPRDFIWQYMALFQIIAFVFFMNTVKANARPEAKLYSGFASQLALLSAGILLVNYYCHSMVVPSSLAAKHFDGLGLIIQYNPYGLFIAMEELGYLLQCASLLSLVPIFSKSKAGSPIKLTILAASALVLASFAAITAIFGLDKQDRFEIAVISIDWIALIIIGFMASGLFRREGMK